ncbi:MAG: AMP-binding protein [Alphaproteobacteria bacterium]|nr:AMP-binding protein [Alphaproteobacteria bacterium]
MATKAPSYAHGASATPLIGETIGVRFDRTVERWGVRPGLIVSQQSIHWTYQELGAKVDAFAAGLLALGLRPSDRIGIWSPNNAEWVVTQFATAKAGLILVNINPAYRLAELEYALNMVGCRALITTESFRSSDYVGMINALVPELASSDPGQLKADKLPELRTVIQIGGAPVAGTFGFETVYSMGREAERARLAELKGTMQFDDPINIQFTSGTTGLPKGATLTHHNILNNGYFLGEAMHFGPEDRVCIPVPLYHCFGMVIGNLACITHGSAMVLPGEGFDPLVTLKTVSDEKCTALYGVPTMFIAELDHPEFPSFELSSLRTGMMAGAPCPIEIMRRCVEDMHLSEMTIGYGMTETSPVSTQTLIGDSLEKQTGTVGRVHPHVEIKIIDPEGRIVPRGETGEFCTRGYSVMLGYWDDAEKTAEAIDANGWMHTGDLATMDEDGYCKIVGRIKDMVIRGGENIYPREIEEFLYRHPAVQDVQVFGVPDERYGEELCAWIQVRSGETLTEEDVKAFCTGQIAHYKVPRHIRFVDDFPMTVTGKIQKFVMRERMAEELERLQ